MCVHLSLRRLECRSASLVVVGGDSLRVVRIWGHVLSPPTGGSALVNNISGGLCPSTSLRAVVSASILCVAPVCDLTLPICVLYPMVSLVCMIPSPSRKRSLCGWWMKLSRSMAYLFVVLMLKAISIRLRGFGQTY